MAATAAGVAAEAGAEAVAGAAARALPALEDEASAEAVKALKPDTFLAALPDLVLVQNLLTVRGAEVSHLIGWTPLYDGIK